MSRAQLDADDAASLLRELAWLRKRGGFTAARLVQAPIVDEVLRGSLEDSFERLRYRFVSAIHSLSESGSEEDEPLVGVLLAALRRWVVAACWSGDGRWPRSWGAAWRRSPHGRRPACVCCTAAW